MAFFRKKNLLLITTAILSCVYAVLYAGRGIDMTDAGLQLYLQKNAFSGSGDTWMTVPLTNFIGGAWLSLSPENISVLWSYLGGAVLYVIIMLTSLKIYFYFFDEIDFKDWLLVIGIALFIPQRMAINYYTFPVMLSFVFFYVLLKSLKENCRRDWFLLGIIGGVVVFSRFTFATILLIPFLLYHHREKSKRTLLYCGSGLSTALIPLSILFLIWKSQFPTSGSELTYANIIYRIKSFAHIGFPIWHVFSQACAIICLVLTVERIFSYKAQKVIGRMFLLFTIFCASAMLVFYTAKDREWTSFFGAPPNTMLILYIIPSLLFVVLFFAVTDESVTDIMIDKDIEKPYIISLCLFSLIIPLGSDVAYCKLGYMAPAYLMILGGCLLHRMKGEYPIRRCVFLAIISGGIVVRPLYSYLDAPVFRCNTMPSFSGLKYMYTTKKRANDWEALLNALSVHGNGEKEILLAGYLNFGPLYLLNYQDWNHGVCTGGNDFMKRFLKNSASKPLPRIALADENSAEFSQLKSFLIDRYERVFLMDRGFFNYSIWKIK